MFNKVLLLCLFTLGVCECTLEESLPPPCNKNDTECIRETFNYMFSYIADNGSPECGIDDPIDPFDLEKHNYHVELFSGALNITVDNGFLKNLRYCTFPALSFNLDLGVGNLKAVCKETLVIDGDYHFSTISTPIDPLIGGEILHGDGKAHITVDGLELNFPFTVQLVEGSDGVRHLKFQKEFTYNLKSLTFHVTEVYFGDKDITDLANEIVQNNYKLLLVAVGRQFVGAAVKIYREESDKVFDCIPAKDIINLS